MLKTARNTDEEYRCRYCGRNVERTDQICFDLDLFPEERICWHVCSGCRDKMRQKSREFHPPITIGEKDILC